VASCTGAEGDYLLVILAEPWVEHGQAASRGPQGVRFVLWDDGHRLVLKGLIRAPPGGHRTRKRERPVYCVSRQEETILLLAAEWAGVINVVKILKPPDGGQWSTEQKVILVLRDLFITDRFRRSHHINARGGANPIWYTNRVLRS
jgi:hypothetical protein